MGGYAVRIGKYSAYYGDWTFDYIKEGKPKEYYENLKFDVTLKTRGGVEEEIEVPALGVIIDIRKKVKYYGWKRPEDDHSFAKWFFSYLRERFGYYPKGQPYIHSRYDSEIPIKAILHSTIGDTRGMEFRPDSNAVQVFREFNDLLWVHDRGLEIDWLE